MLWSFIPLYGTTSVLCTSIFGEFKHLPLSQAQKFCIQLTTDAKGEILDDSFILYLFPYIGFITALSLLQWYFLFSLPRTIFSGELLKNIVQYMVTFFHQHPISNILPLSLIWQCGNIFGGLGSPGHHLTFYPRHCCIGSEVFFSTI